MTAPTEPGVHDGVPERDYHADRDSFSVSGAKLLIGKSPAHFAWEREHPTEKRTYDFGHAAHAEVLGVGRPVEVLQTDVVKATKTAPAQIGDARNRLSNYTKAHEKDCYDRGLIPLLRDEYETVQAMAAKLREHPVASTLFDPAHGKPEQSGYFRDEPTGVLRRFRLDWLPDQRGGRIELPDYKTTTDASPHAVSRYLTNFGYAMQSKWYIDGAEATLDVEEADFLLVLQEKTAPYVVTVARPDALALVWGERQNRAALDLYAKCTAENHWPPYSEDVVTVTVPNWALSDLEFELEMT